MKYIFVPIIKLIIALFTFPLKIFILSITTLFYCLWHLKLKLPFTYKYYPLEYVEGEEWYEEELIYFKTDFHWALNIGGITINNPNCLFSLLSENKPKSTSTEKTIKFKQFLKC